jgi:hypothetical protein
MTEEQARELVEILERLTVEVQELAVAARVVIGHYPADAVRVAVGELNHRLCKAFPEYLK